MSTIQSIRNDPVESLVTVIKQLPYVAAYAVAVGLAIVATFFVYQPSGVINALIIISLVAGLSVRLTVLGIDRVVGDE